MPTSSAREDYLKTVFHLGRSGRRVLTSEIAAGLGVSGPSVTGMIQRLSRDGLLDYSPRRGVRLTEAGRSQTLHVVRRHRLLETFLVEVLGLDWSEVHAEAEVLEHHLSERMVDAIDFVLGHPSEDPHGHPIPDRNGRVKPRTLTPLSQLESGSHAVVRELRDADRPRMAHWKDVGLVPGAHVHMRAIRPLDDVFELEVSSRRLVTGSEGLEGVMVEVPRNSPRGGGRKGRAA